MTVIESVSINREPILPDTFLLMTNELRELQKLGRNLKNMEIYEVPKGTERVCFVIISPQSKLDQSAYFDAVKAAKIFFRADFKIYFLDTPEYSDYYLWMTYFLKTVDEYLSIVITGFTMNHPDGYAEDEIPLKIRDREIAPLAMYKMISKYKNPSSRLTILINGCPATESWSGDSTGQSLSFSMTASTFQKPKILHFSMKMPEKILLITSTPRIDVPINDRSKGNYSIFITELSHAVKADPSLNVSEILDIIGTATRKYGEEIVVYASSFDVESEIPFLY